MAVRKKVTQPVKVVRPDSFAKKYGLQVRAGLDSENKDAFVIPLGLSEGVYTLWSHELNKAADGTGFRGLGFKSRIACHRIDKTTGEAATTLPACCRILQQEKERLGNDDNFATKSCITWAKQRIFIPVLVLSTTETDPTKRLGSRKISISHGIDFSFIDMAEYTYDNFVKATAAIIENDDQYEDADDIGDDNMYEVVGNYIRHSIIKISTYKGNISNKEKTFQVIPFTNKLVAKDSGEKDQIKCLSDIINGFISGADLDEAYENYPLVQTCYKQVLDYMELFDKEVDTIIAEWDDSELEAYYKDFLDKQGVVDMYKSDPVETSKEESVSFTQNEAVETEEDFEYSTGDLEESSILEDSAFDEDEFSDDEFALDPEEVI